MRSNIGIYSTRNMGKGVFAEKDFAEGELIMTFPKGKIVKDAEVKNLNEWEQDHVDELDDGLREVMQPPGCYVNHSCQPNAMLTDYEFIALRLIKKGEEITSDYRMKADTGHKWECDCGACDGEVVHDFFEIPVEFQRIYLPYTLRSIREEWYRRNEKE